MQPALCINLCDIHLQGSLTLLYALFLRHSKYASKFNFYWTIISNVASQLTVSHYVILYIVRGE